jgi:hypothetical protein
MKCRFAVFFTAFTLAVGSAQTRPKTSNVAKPQWREYAYPKDGFAITLPEKPDPHKAPQFSDGTIYTVHFGRDVTFSLHVGTFPTGCGDVFDEYLTAVRRSIPQMKKGEWTGSNPSFRGDPSSVRERDVEGYLTVEHEQEVRTGEETFSSYERWQCVDKKLYVFTAKWPGGLVRPNAVGQIVDSFRLSK